MKNKFSLGAFGVLVLIVSGCVNCAGTSEPPVIPAVDSAKTTKNNTPQIPPAEKDPQIHKKANVSPSPAPTAAVTRKQQPALPPQVSPAPKKETPSMPPPARKPQHRRSPNDFRRGPGAWRAFTRLPREEQRKLLELQRTSPEEFRKILREKADELYQQEAARRQEIDQLTEKILQAESPAVAEKLKKVLRAKLKEDFQQRLNDTRRDIEAYKHRTARLESELQKREKNCDAIVDAILRKRLADKKAAKVEQPKKK